MKKLRIEQVRSGIGRPADQKRTLIALGIKKMHQVKEVEATPVLLGMIDKVKHLLTIEEI
jgi:large subunit ribosomal protein L30